MKFPTFTNSKRTCTITSTAATTSSPFGATLVGALVTLLIETRAAGVDWLTPPRAPRPLGSSRAPRTGSSGQEWGGQTALSPRPISADSTQFVGGMRRNRPGNLNWLYENQADGPARARSSSPSRPPTRSK